MSSNYQSEYDKLNTAQRAAVDTIDGPVLVVAGPGTGKTQLLSVRVANILQKTDTDPSSILCLTFTNYAATNMRERLTMLVGSSAQNVMVRTFHSFAAEIMNLYPDYFWNGARLTIAPDAVQLEILQTIVASLPLSNPLASKFAGNFTGIRDIQQALRLSKEAGLTPSKLAAMLDINDAYLDVIEPSLVEALASPLSIKKLKILQAAIDTLPDQLIDEAVAPLTSLSTVLKQSLEIAVAQDQIIGKTTNTGAWKRKWIQTVAGEKGMFDERRRAAWWRAFVDVYASYRDALHQHGYYDYSDMIIEVISQLEQNPELLASVQERFLYVLIDEFQDTNAAQLRLAHLVSANASNEGRPNLMAVGDDDQSIFAFNGAELNNMLSFQRTYASTKLVVLNENYRSHQSVLDVSAAIMEQASDRLVLRVEGLTKQLHAATEQPAGMLAHQQYPTREHQLSAIAHQVAERWRTNPESTIAILARGHDSLKRISSLLTSLQIPISYERQNDILQHEAVQQIILLAKLVVSVQSGDLSDSNQLLSRLLRHPMWGASPETLWKLAILNRRNGNWLDSLLKHHDATLRNVAHWILWLAQEAYIQPLPVMLEYILGLKAGEHLTSPLREYYMALRTIDSQYLETLSAINQLLGITREFANTEQASLEDFVRFIIVQQQTGQGLSDLSWFVSGEQAVQIMTVHKAKGLEFDTVYLLDAIEDNWRPRHSGRKPPANLPLQPYGEQPDDYVRLLYVAATRAKSTFIASSFSYDDQGRAIIATPLLHPIPVGQASTADEPIVLLEQALSWPRLESTDEKRLLQPVIEDYRLSATALLDFLDVSRGGPQYFLERHLLHLPQPTSAVMAYGTAIHQALQAAQQLAKQGTIVLDKVLDSYQYALGEQLLSPMDYERYLPHGQQIIRTLFGPYDFTLAKDGQAEVTISEVRLGDARLTGKLDHVQPQGNGIIISDYKTGVPLTSFTTRDQTKRNKAWRHRTQLLFYALLAQQSGRFKTASVQAAMIYVEAEQAKGLYLTLSPSPEDLQRLETLIQAVWTHITNVSFPNTDSYTLDASGMERFEQDLLDGAI